MNESLEQDHQNYAKEKLWEALGCLIGEGTLRLRLNDASMFTMRLWDQHFPDQLRPKFFKLHETLTRNGAEISGAFQPTALEPALKSDELADAAREILSLHINLNGGI